MITRKTTVVLSYTIEAASNDIATGRCKLHTQQVLVEILAMMEEQDDLRQQGPASSTMNDEITKVTSDYKRRQWREFVESMDHGTGSTKLWRTIKGIDGISNQTAKNEGSTFTGRPHTSPKMIAISLNCQSCASTLHRGGLVRCRGCKADVFRGSRIIDQVTRAIKTCKSSRARGPDPLSIFHLKKLVSLAAFR